MLDNSLIAAYSCPRPIAYSINSYRDSNVLVYEIRTVVVIHEDDVLVGQ